MKLPYAIRDLESELVERWHTYFNDSTGRDPKLEEGLWRRTQDVRNADESGWLCDRDCRRRLIHYRYTYDVVFGTSPRLCLVTFYLMYSVTYPNNEIERISQSIERSLDAGGWTCRRSGSFWERGDLQMMRTLYLRHPMDGASGRRVPANYRSLDLTIRSSRDATGPVDRGMPWDVLARGMRIKDRREDPHIVDDLRGIEEYLPFHLEVGCGLSMEAGVPPLHFLHDVYQVTDRERNTFVLDPEHDDIVQRLLASPESVMPLLTQMYRDCFLAEPSETHWHLKTLADDGFLVGPVMTNNFDGLLQRVGLEELYLRRYDQDVPDVEFDSKAKALLVIGNHADRRRVERRARARGMTVFFVDPEGFWEGETFNPYPLEGVQRNDFLCRQAAAPAVRGLTNHLMGMVGRH